MKNLLIFTENYARGGGNRYMIDMTNALALVYEQEFLFSNAGGIFSEDTRRLSSPVVQYAVPFITKSRISNNISSCPKIIRKILALFLIAFEPLFFLANTILFVWVIRKIKPAIILCCNGGYPAAQACLAMVLAGKVLKIPVVLSVVSMPTQYRFITWIYEKVVDWIVWRAVSVVVVNAKSIASALCKLRGAPMKKIKVVYNGLENKQITPTQSQDDKRNFVIGCVARMDKEKGVLILFDAFAYLAKTRPEMQLVLAGHGNASAEIAKRTKILGLQKQVQLLGHYDGDVSSLLNTFDIYVFPSLWEGFPYSIVEALRSACVIVATRVGGISEAVTDGVEGVLIAPGARDEIIRAIERLMSDQEMCKILARNARAKFERELTLPIMHVRVREIFSELKREEALWQKV